MKGDDIILGILSEKPASGYEIKERFSTIFSNFYNASFGSIYPILHKLTDEQKVTFKTVEQDGKPNKKIYSITAQGREAFQNYLSRPVENKKIKWDFMVHLFYSDQLTPNERMHLIENEIKTRRQECQELEALKQTLAGKDVDKNKIFCLELGIKQKNMVIQELEWFLDSNMHTQ
ncbi:PadR family transcriptional regulator [Convivina intestini]|uniref:PadR family transcriptional regulator n=1 Tax=Convivina intestini TaxID=1505726 RepID=UPI00200C0FDC|nr:PadR family transcriptional regulator [Convivina intestini]CAH1851753.1 hypothetical protein R078131_00333 [Convivina intestini]